MNTRMVQGIFDDRSPASAAYWQYPDTKQWDAARNTREFVAAMPIWRQHGVLSFNLNMQGGNPRGYAPQQPWITGAFTPRGELIPLGTRHRPQGARGRSLPRLSLLFR